jgi:RNA polymerase primary sigma factor
MKNTIKTGGKKQETEDILQIYFNQIRAYPLLEAEEELELARLIEQGDQNALHKLIRSNLRLVVKIARGYATSDVPFMDLVQEGNLGLMHAAEKFDYAKNLRFCTYAGWWIRQFISRYLTNKRRVVRLPHRKEEMLRKIQHTYHTLSQTLMHQPRTEDIADELGIPVQDINFIVNMSSGPLPLELDAGRDDGGTVMNVHEDYTYSPERTLFQQYYRDETQRFLGRLKDRERQVLSYRYQLEDGEPHTLKEIGDKMDLSPETIRQIEKKALIKIRSHANELRNYGLLEAM